MLKAPLGLVPMTSFPLLRRHLVEGSVLGDAGIIDQHLDRA